MSRADRWWRPAPRRNVRPGVRARRHVVTEGDVIHGFGLGYDIGQADERKRHERLEGGLRRLMDAIRESENGDPSALDDLAREAAADDLLDVANAAGVTPLDEHLVNGDQMFADLEAWLRGQEGDG